MNNHLNIKIRNRYKWQRITVESPRASGKAYATPSRSCMFN